MRATKTCTRCGAEYPATTEYWHKKRNGRHGLTPDCKGCRNEYNRQWREANPDKDRERKRQYREANADKVSERMRRYYKANADKIREQGRQWREANRDRVREYNRQRREGSRTNGMAMEDDYYE